MKRLLLGVAVAGCAASDLSRTKSTIADTWHCPAEQQKVVAVEKGFYADACGRKILCSSPSGPCEESLTYAEQLMRTQQVIARDMGCTEVTVDSGADGVFYGQGCGHDYFCQTHDGPCRMTRPLTCNERAQRHHDDCVSFVEKRRQKVYVGSPAAIAGMAVMSGIAANKSIEGCDEDLKDELQRCP
jgi:hypothetical protein